ncbi:MAG: aspartate--tRNA ligase [Spirochaetes bacterium]|nr:aspartate--tRNA ligase [Spirochaetota bacterium]MBX3723878.1 aspartate--tRNA ligase [Turneriella sp.]
MSSFSLRRECNSVGPADNEKSIVVCGWVYRYRDQGGVLFVDLRDRSGLVQVVFDLAVDAELHKKANALRGEDVILVTGKVRLRDKNAINPKLKTGEIEIVAHELELLSKAKPSPIPLDEHDGEASEELRLEYRFLDLRRKPMQEALRVRHEFIRGVRNFLDNEGFWEVETPILNKSTPEGARDFLVPSRLNAGEFYALPQSPQIFKQLLMVAGSEKYYQIARCFRDEDLRKDRQPEFTQIDIEMSFVDKDMVMALNERLIASACKAAFGVEIDGKPQRMTYHDAMELYGNDKPDIRFGMTLTELGDWAAMTEFKVFKGAAETGRLKALCVPGGAAKVSRKDIDDLTQWVMQDYKAKGLAWVKVGEGGALESLITKFLPEAAQAELVKRTGAKPGDIIFFAGDRADIVFATLSALRLRLAEKLGMIPDTYKALWVVDFPLFDWDHETNSLLSVHHPFTAPVPEDAHLVKEAGKKESLTAEEQKALLAVRSNAYDFVLNGVEIGGGSIRIHESELQQAIFRLLKISDEEAQSRFGFLLKGLEFGAPPHGGIAFGVDRVLMLGLKKASIRDVMAFPKTQKGTCLMSGAPSLVDEKQLRELYLKSTAKAR